MLDYTMTLSTWKQTYRPFVDGLFLASFSLTFLCILILITLFVVYKLKPYKTTQKLNVPKGNKRKIEYRSPKYIHFMQ